MNTPAEISDEITKITTDAANIVHESIDLSRLGYVGLLRPFVQRAVDLGARSGGVSERALIEARREGYGAGINDAHYDQVTCAREQRDHGLYVWNHADKSPWLGYGAISKRAAERYPLPRVTRPLRVTLSQGEAFSYEPRSDDDQAPFLNHGRQGWRYSAIGVAAFVKTADDIRALARILSGETEEVEADEPAPAPCSSRGSLNEISGMGLRD